jgi:hypothetical protein
MTPTEPTTDTGGHSSALGWLHRCPGCASDELEAVSDGELVNFLCGECGRCWHVAHGWVARVSPPTCPGCPHRGECQAIWLADHPEATGPDSDVILS